MVHRAFADMRMIFLLIYAVDTLGRAQSSITLATTVANIIDMISVPLIAAACNSILMCPFRTMQ